MSCPVSSWSIYIRTPLFGWAKWWNVCNLKAIGLLHSRKTILNWISNWCAWKRKIMISSWSWKKTHDLQLKLRGLNDRLHEILEKQKRQSVTYECDVCSKRIGTRRSFLRHFQVVHLRAYNKECTRCGKRFASNSCLKRHMDMHAGIRVHACVRCGKRFTQNCNLIVHEGKCKEWISRKISLYICSTLYIHIRKYITPCVYITICISIFTTSEVSKCQKRLRAPIQFYIYIIISFLLRFRRFQISRPFGNCYYLFF